MNSRLILLSCPIGRSVTHLCRTIVDGSLLGCRGYYQSRTRKPTLYSKISPLGNPSASVSPELDQWVQAGNKIRFAELQRIIRDLRKRKRYNQALEVSQWVYEKGLFAFTTVEHAVQLDLLGRVHGFSSAEKYFNDLEDEHKTEKTYGALLNCYTRQLQIDKSLSHLRKMQEMGLASSALTYNDIMCLYANTGQYEKVPSVMYEMMERGVRPDNFSYRICMNSYGARSDIQGMDRILKEMETQPHIAMDWNTYSVAANFYIKAGLTKKALIALKRAEDRLDKKDGLGYNHLITHHAALGNKSEILRLWGLEKEACRRCINQDYMTVLRSLTRVGELEEAEKMLEEWESSGNFYDFRVPDIVILGYIEKGLLEKAEALLDDLMENGKATSPETWAKLALAYFDRGDMERTVESMKVCLSLHESTVKQCKPDPKVIRATLVWLGDNASFEDVEAYVVSLKSVAAAKDRCAYHALLKAGLRHGKEVSRLLERMRADGMDEDEETKQILFSG
ncbi:hypothetical protein SAY86_030150 [Trapa natans]|uniref:Pentatricopeptide repeat-containing protein n=1 Tax=Trapa natans TaxID=22666 RepID=A0AAN7RAB7_TRANT|nr:hypothetical protein SAY86_030150 [Trapa natans]